MKLTRKHYTHEFKVQALKLLESGRTPTTVAKELGIPEQTLSNWRKASASGQLNKLAHDVTPEQMEVSRLRSENQRLKAELDIIKKAAAYFAKDSL